MILTLVLTVDVLHPLFELDAIAKQGTSSSKDGSDASMWLGHTIFEPVLMFGSENYKHVMVQWYKPSQRHGREENVYNGWNTQGNFKWTLDATFLEQWICMDSIFTAWKSRCRGEMSMVCTPRRQVAIAMDNLQCCASHEAQLATTNTFCTSLNNTMNMYRKKYIEQSISGTPLCIFCDLFCDILSI